MYGYVIITKCAFDMMPVEHHTLIFETYQQALTYAKNNLVEAVGVARVYSNGCIVPDKETLLKNDE